MFAAIKEARKRRNITEAEIKEQQTKAKERDEEIIKKDKFAEDDWLWETKVGALKIDRAPESVLKAMDQAYDFIIDEKESLDVRTCQAHGYLTAPSPNLSPPLCLIAHR